MKHLLSLVLLTISVNMFAMVPADPNALLIKQASEIVKRYPAIIESIKDYNLNQAGDIKALEALKNQATTPHAKQFIQTKIDELSSKLNLIEQKAPSCVRY